MQLGDFFKVGSRSVPLLFVHHPRARRYLLRLRPDGVARVTIPRRGTIKAARDFASRNIAWLEKQIQLQADQPKTPVLWGVGTEVYFRGGLVLIEVVDGNIRFGSEQIKVSVADDLRPAIQKHLHKLAAHEPVSYTHLVAQASCIFGVNDFRIHGRDAGATALQENERRPVPAALFQQVPFALEPMLWHCASVCCNLEPLIPACSNAQVF